MSFLKLSLPQAPDRYDYECVVVGAGPAGLTAALYLARYRVDVAVVTEAIGGEMALAPLVDDYPGLPGLTGSEMTRRFEEHVRRYKVPIITGERMVGLEREGDRWVVVTASGNRYSCYALILAIGSRRRKLGVPGEEKLIGRGVSYCATCDGPLFEGKTVAVVGGGNAALSSALYLASIARKVYLIHRREQFRAFPHYVEMARRSGRIELLLNHVVERILGEDRVTGVQVRNLVENASYTLPLDGVFVEIGSEPPRELLEPMGLELDDEGRVVVKPDMSTNLPGVFAAGEVAGGPCKYKFDQILTAAAEGAIAADAAYKYILGLRGKL
ncbi:MAG: FAD-dependent oxidoreductase [Thermofilaceae archaeon]